MRDAMKQLAGASAALALVLPGLAGAQGTAMSVQFPGGYAPGEAPCVLQTNGTCAPVSAANPLPVTGGSGGGTPVGSAGAPNAGVVTVQGVTGGTALLVSGSLSVANFPATQPVSGSLAVTNFPATQPVSGTVAIGNFPATQSVSGSLAVTNLPATQAISAAALPLPAGAALDTSVQAVAAAIGATPAVKQADAYASGTIAAGTANAAYTLAIANGAGSGGVVLSGLTASGAVLVPEGSYDGTSFVGVSIYQSGTKVGLTSIVADGQYRFNVSGRRAFRFRVTTTGSGTISATSTASVAAFDPPSATLDANGNASVTGQIFATASFPVNVATAATVQLVASVAGKAIYVHSFDFIAAGTTNVTLEYGTGTACGTATTVLTGPYPLTAQAGLSASGGNSPKLFVPSGNALCLVNSAAIQVSGSGSYAQQ